MEPRIRFPAILCAVWLLLLPGRLQAQPLLQEPRSPPAAHAVVVAVEGRALVARAGLDDWKAPTVGDALLPGDRFRTLERSRAVIRLSDLSLLRLGELSYVELPAPTTRRGGLQFLRGLLYYFHRDKPGVLPVSTPSAHAVVLGTEFVLAVAEDGSSQLSMLDGVVELTNAFGRLQLGTGESAMARAQAAPARVAAVAPATSMQWILYYPGVLDPAELPFPAASREALQLSLRAYRDGDLLSALSRFPPDRPPGDPAETVYLAALQLAAGLVDRSAGLLNTLPESQPGIAGVTNVAAHLAVALRRLTTLTQTGTAPPASEPVTATEWLVESLARQARSDLVGALQAARAAVKQSPEFAFGWTQEAELTFAFGHIQAAREAVARSLALAPRNPRAHALNGFILAARQEFSRAIESFDQAIALNGAMADGWLGRGLCRFHRGDLEAGRADLQTAVTVEPQRALPRSYLAKAYAETHDAAHARQELDLSGQLDSADPTRWLYSALLRQQQNQINQGIDDLEQAKAFNDQRSLFRSRLLLDQDRAVGAANLASLYRDAGLVDYSAREAAAATIHDYANSSAHLFLANSFNALRDPNLVELRYETPAVSEYLMANLLAPVGGSGLSPMISQQEYSPLFDRNRVGLASDTRYTSDGAWSQDASHYGVLDRLGFALDAHWRRTPGHRRNSDLEQFVGSGQFKIQLSPQTSAYLLASYATVETGDVRPYYDDREASPTLRLKERQEPNVFAGVHHRWAPGIHTLFLAGRVNDTLIATEPQATVQTLVRDSAGTLTGVLHPADSVFDLRYHSVLNAWSAELQQVFQTPRHLWLIGGRYQTGELETSSVLGRDPFAFPPVFDNPAADQEFSDSLDRVSLYGYWHWQVWETIRLIAGGSYDWMRYPLNFNAPPIASGTTTDDRFSPKAGFLWSPLTNFNVRGAYTRSLGGVTYDNSIRLEPTQLAGFIQSYRSLIPESRAGLVPGTEFETFELGFDRRFPTRTYLIAEAGLRRSEGRRFIGVFDYTDAPPFVAVPSNLRQRLRFEERSLALSLNQLLADEWALSARYRLTDAALRTAYPALPATIDPAARTDDEALLHQVDLAVLYHHASGFFARGEALWRRQDNRRDSEPLHDEDLWQFNLWAGWRFAQRRVEMSVGLLNLTGRDYRLNPLNSTYELPHERLLATQLRWSF